jgi:hypothetical protein
MIATYHGQLMLKLQTGDVTIAVNPISKDSGRKTTRFGSDICLITTSLDICNGYDQVDNAGKSPFIISGPGEYEAKGISIKGIQSKYIFEGKEKINTIYTFIFDGMKICVLGALHERLDADLRDAISSCDILFVPVLENSKNNYLSAKDAVAVGNNLDAKIIIPVGYDERTMPTFLKESGSTGVRPIEKLTIKKKELDGKEGVVVTLEEI